jgi:hypothetical protein
MRPFTQQNYFCVAVIIVFLITVGCASHSSRRLSVYENWGEQLSNSGTTIRTVDDVSFLLGSPPTKCDNIKPTPMIGIKIGLESTDILSVDPNGAASVVGIKAGEKIVKVNETKVYSGKDILSALSMVAEKDETVIIQTNVKTYSVSPSRPIEAKQCYWDITAGAVAETRGGAYVNQYGGSAGHSGSEYQRFFRASCRFYDGRAVNCQSNWQE